MTLDGDYSRRIKSPVTIHDEMISRRMGADFISDSSHHSKLPPASSPQIKSPSIPIVGSIDRTSSEIQLCLDEEVAERRDYAFYSRVLDGISRSQPSNSSNWILKRENQNCLQHIMQTRRADSRSNGDEAAAEQEEAESMIDNDWAVGHNLDGNEMTTSNEKISETIDMVQLDDEDGIFDLDM